ncbi:hypothetical protein [Snodgrassella alvi]|uniref:hypothetical protein n=1 Tax=Snodgrassella alvi TaxID=1196083 RepID=UPI001FD1D655|nr:hypothetical protein [Snodgrassella alvi]UOO98880.1 hypothetical protein LVJ87_01165 [Snodgrassella alvi wkB2]
MPLFPFAAGFGFVVGAVLTGVSELFSLLVAAGTFVGVIGRISCVFSGVALSLVLALPVVAGRAGSEAVSGSVLSEAAIAGLGENTGVGTLLPVTGAPVGVSTSKLACEANSVVSEVEFRTCHA